MISNFIDAERALQPFIDHNSGEYTVETTSRLARHVGSPHERLKIIHIAGTSGKTSTCYYLRELLETAGQKTGLTVSPHIETIADRVQVGGLPLDEQVFCHYLDQFLRIIEAFDGSPSYFEVMMVFALWVFDKEEVDYAVIETGLGGLHDSSNICQRADKLCVLTDIGLDHMNVLGSTLTEITQQKIGIVAPGNKLVMYRQSEEVMQVVNKQSIEVIFVEPDDSSDFRKRNFKLAFGAYQWLRERDSLPRLDQKILTITQQVIVPGRLEQYRLGNAIVVLDGAHNQQKVRALVSTFARQYPGTMPTIVLAMKQGKEYEAFIDEISKIAEEFIATEYQTFQDTRLGSVEASVLAEYAISQGRAVKVVAEINEAVNDAVLHSHTVLVTGSLYAVSEARQWLRGQIMVD